MWMAPQTLLLCLCTFYWQLQGVSASCYSEAPKKCPSSCEDCWAPVCGRDGVTYWNVCLALCQNVKVASRGPCKGDALAQLHKPGKKVGKLRPAQGWESRGGRATGERLVGRVQLLDSSVPVAARSVARRAEEQPAIPPVDQYVRVTAEGEVFVSSGQDNSSANTVAVGARSAGYPSGVLPGQGFIPPRMLAAVGQLLDPCMNRVTNTRKAPVGGCENMRYPRSAVGQIIVQGGAGCTGVLVSPWHVLTAAHCVYSKTMRSWYRGIKFMPGRCNKCTGSRQCTPSEPFSALPYSWIFCYSRYVANADQTYDIALVRLSSPTGLKAGFLGFGGSGSLCDNDPQPVTLPGYPLDSPPGGVLWRSSCTVRSNVCRIANTGHQCDTSPGMSGAPIWPISCVPGPQRPRVVIAVHTGSVTGVDKTATAITAFHAHYLRKWIAENRK